LQGAAALNGCGGEGRFALDVPWSNDHVTLRHRENRASVDRPAMLWWRLKLLENGYSKSMPGE
jgi:hypothetical protein